MVASSGFDEEGGWGESREMEDTYRVLIVYKNLGMVSS